VIPGYEEVVGVDSSKREFEIPGRILHQPKFPRPSGRGLFTVHPLHENSLHEDDLQMMSVRSEGQFNTVVYEEEDRYRGQERRDVVLMNEEDMKRRGLSENQRVDVKSAVGQMSGLFARSFAIRQGCVLMYYPEVNAIIGRAVDPESRTPAFKATAVRISASCPL
jgi:anaerobic selenocysteine-containing dehydrogenase